jgi:hypothetical protein
MSIPARWVDGSLTCVGYDDVDEVIYNSPEPHECICPQCGKVHGGESYDGWRRAMTLRRIAYAARDLAPSFDRNYGSNQLGQEIKQRVESELCPGMARLIRVGRGLMLADCVTRPGIREI